MRIRGLDPDSRPALAALLESIDSFDAAEVAVALELADAALEDPRQPDYRFLLAWEGEALAGYICFGPTPMTEGTVDLYWLATSPAFTRRGVARRLVEAMEAQLRVDGARMVRVETASRDGYGAAAAFYLAAGYEEAARLRDFYSEGDDLITFTRRFTPERALDDEVEAYRLAFEYRDFAAERDFLIACSARFGLGDPGRVVEWACGPAQHLEHFGRDRARALVGVDPSEEMLQAARQRLGARAELILADLCEWVVRPGADLGFVPLSAVHQLARAERIRAFLEVARRSLVPGGVLVVEATHPRDLTPEGAWATHWRIHDRGVEIEARTRFDLARRVGPQVPVTLSIRSRRDGAVRDHVREMTWYVPDLAEWEALAQAAGLEVAATLGDLDTGTPFTHPSAWRLVLVLRAPR